jgi:hypothetical protein
MLGEIRGIEGREMLIAVDADINPEYLELLAHGQKNYVALELLDNRRISPKQNKVAHALIGDIANWQGDFPIVTEQFLKYYFMAQSGKWFSHATATRSEARDWVDFLIEFVLSNNISLPKRYEYLTENSSWFFYCLKYRKCCICGKHADIAHVEAVGMGRNRYAIDHSGHRFMALCREHHMEQHTIGILLFLELHDVMPLYLDYEQRKKLNVGG